MRASPDPITDRLKPLHPLLRNAGIEGGAIALRLGAYLGSLGAIGLLTWHVWSGAGLFQPGPAQAARPVASQWIDAVRPQPAFAAPVAELSGKAQTYAIQRHPQGGRKDVLRFVEADGGPVAVEFAFYRPGAELAHFRPATEEIASRPDAAPESAQASGVIETKFGAVPLVGFVRTTGAANQPCTGFVREFDTPRLQISGFSCLGATPQLQRQSIACAFDRLTMLSSGSDTTLAALFARAELKRAGCGAPPAATDWITATGDPALRGSFAAMRK